jgi:hypothetical protein
VHAQVTLNDAHAVLPEWVDNDQLLCCRRSHDDARLWLCPFDARRAPPRVTITFTQPTTLALVRVWVRKFLFVSQMLIGRV